MSRLKITSIFSKLVVAAIAASGMLSLGTQNAGAQAIIVTTPFAFTAGGQSYPAGTYEFTLLSEWLLSISKANGGNEKYFTVRPEDDRSPGSKGSLTFRNSNGHQNLRAIYVPETGRTAELLQRDEVSDTTKSDRSLASLYMSPGELQPESKNAKGR